MSSTPSKIPTFGSKPARQESKSATSTPLSKDARRDASRKSGPATPKSEARKPRGAPASLSASSTPLSIASSSSLSSKPQQGNSARELSELKKENASLKKENTSLKKELEELKLLHSQLVQEGPTERFAEQRVNLLKTQIVQLERQVVLLSQALSSRTELVLDLQAMLDSLVASLRDNVKEEGQSEVLKLASAINNRLIKHSQSSSLENLAQPLQFLEDFVQPKKTSSMAEGGTESVTVLDVCSGHTDHINLKQVNRLESKLVQLYSELTQLQSSLDVSGVNKSPSLLRPMEEHASRHVTQCSKLIGECCQSLLCFSLLVPSAHLPPLKGTEKVTLDFSAVSVLKKLPASVRNKREVKEAIEAAATAMTHHNEMNTSKCRVLEEELQFHKAVYDLQISYVDSLFKAMRDGYETFEESVQDSLCSPLNEVLESYSRLSQTASDDALRDFLEVIKKNHEQLQEALASFSKAHTQSEASVSRTPQGVETLSLYGQHFFEQLSQLEAECNHVRGRGLETIVTEPTCAQTVETTTHPN